MSFSEILRLRIFIDTNGYISKQRRYMTDSENEYSEYSMYPGLMKEGLSYSALFNRFREIEEV